MMHDVLCVYGGEMPSLLEEYSSWLEQQEQRHLLLVRPHEAEMFLELHPRIHLLHENAHPERMRHILSAFALCPLEYKVHASLENGEKALDALRRIERLHLGVSLSFLDFRDLGKKILANYLANFLRISSAKKARDLFGAFSGVPALICGAGPSLEEDMENLKKWKNRALIFAGGSAIQVLRHFSLEPDFIAALDPERDHKVLPHVPFFYQSRVAKELLAKIPGEKLWVKDSGGYPLDHFLHSSLGIEEPPFDAGWNVATLCTALAQALGCSPILLAGMDLSTPSEKIYASGVEETVGSDFLETQDVQGKTVWTKKDWLIAASWMEEFFQAHPETPFIVLSKGGLPLKGALRTSSEGALTTWGQKLENFQERIAQEVHKIQAISSLETVQKVHTEVIKSMKTCAELVSKLLVLFEKRYPKLPGETGEGALAEVELEEETFYQTFLVPLWNVWSPVILRENPQASIYVHRLLFFQRVLRI